MPQEGPLYEYEIEIIIQMTRCCDVVVGELVYHEIVSFLFHIFELILRRFCFDYSYQYTLHLLRAVETIYSASFHLFFLLLF